MAVEIDATPGLQRKESKKVVRVVPALVLMSFENIFDGGPMHQSTPTNLLLRKQLVDEGLQILAQP